MYARINVIPKFHSRSQWGRLGTERGTSVRRYFPVAERPAAMSCRHAALRAVVIQDRSGR